MSTKFLTKRRTSHHFSCLNGLPKDKIIQMKGQFQDLKNLKNQYLMVSQIFSLTRAACDVLIFYRLGQIKIHRHKFIN